MIITFNELRRIKDKLPSGSSQRIADELGIFHMTVSLLFFHLSKEAQYRPHRYKSAVRKNPRKMPHGYLEIS